MYIVLIYIEGDKMKKYFLKDTSLNNIDGDLFRYQDFSNNLRKIIEYNESPFNIAIVGKWGLGKSSLVNMALAPLKNKEKEYLICEINAWKYEKDEIGKAFLKELWERIQGKKILSFNFFHKDYNDIVKKMFESEEGALKKNGGLLRFLLYLGATILGSVATFAVYCMLSNKFYGINFNGNTFWLSTFLRYCKNIGSILVIPLVVWLGKLFMDKINAPAYKNYEISFPLETQADYEIYLKSLLQEYYKKNPSKKIVVVIDDLDRLSADKIVEALDALKLFMEYDRFIFIVPFDDEILKNALKEKRIKGISTFDSEYDGEMVLDKIFQFKIYLPQLIKYDMRNYAFEISKKDCADFIREYCNNNYKLFEEIVGKILIHNDVATPRQVKKIINTFVENVMISRDREQANKVGEGFVTEKTGLQTIAKISVMQSDYNEFYDLLFKDVNIINEMLMIHRSNGELSTLIVELSKDVQYDEKMVSIIESNIISGGGSYYSNSKYLFFAIQAVSAYKNRIQQNSVDKYCVALMKVVSISTENVINAYRVIHRFCSNSVWCQNVDVLLNYVSESNYVVIFDVITSRITLFNKENGNLTKLEEFLVDYIDYSDNPNNVINVLNIHFEKIDKLTELISKMMDLECDEDDASIKLAKFIDSCSVETIVEIINTEYKRPQNPSKYAPTLEAAMTAQGIV